MPSCETKPSQEKIPFGGILARIVSLVERDINEVSQRNDEENQRNKASGQGDEVETDSATKELQEAFLSLILVIFHQGPCPNFITKQQRNYRVHASTKGPN
jgi:hypothetical protein